MAERRQALSERAGGAPAWARALADRGGRPHGDVAVGSGPPGDGDGGRVDVHGGTVCLGSRLPSGVDAEGGPPVVSWSPTGPGGSMPDDPRAWMQQQLFERRVVLLSGTLDARSAHEVGAALMTLDAIGDGPVNLQIDCGGDRSTKPWPSWTSSTSSGCRCMPRVWARPPVPPWECWPWPATGPMSAHARLRLAEPTWAMHGRASQLERLASAHADQWRRAFCTPAVRGLRAARRTSCWPEHRQRSLPLRPTRPLTTA